MAISGQEKYGKWPYQKMERAVSATFHSRKLDKFILRFPEGMRDRIADAAKSNNRSMNAEVVSRLQNSFDGGETRTSPDAVARMLDKHFKKLEEILDKRFAAIERKVGMTRSKIE
jgi:hypothetical protein